MKTLKAIAVLMVTVALFFSCELADSEIYGTLVINPSGNSARAVTGKTDSGFGRIEKDISYQFECINEKAGTITTGLYPLNSPQNVVISLVPGKWAVWVKVLQDEGVIGSTQYNNGKPVTIRAGQTIILGGTEVRVSPYGKGTARKVEGDVPDIKDMDEWDEWDQAYTINVNRYIDTIWFSGQPPGRRDYKITTTPPYSPAPHGTAKILWDKSYLYVRVIVVGAWLFGDKESDNYNETSGAFNSNSVEIFFTEKGTIGYQYRITNKGYPTYYTWPEGGTKIPDNISGSDFITKPINNTSYAVYAKIKHDLDTAAVGKTIGVDFQINGLREQNGYRTSIAVWYDGQVFESPGKYANSITLVGVD